MGKIIRNGIEYSGTYDSADSVNYDNSNSGLNARTVQEGIDQLSESLTASDNLKFQFATDGEGNYGYLGADDSFIPFKGEPTFVISGGYRFNINPYTFTESGTYLIVSIDFSNDNSKIANIAYSENVKCTKLSEGNLKGHSSSYGGGGYGINIVEANVGDTIGADNASAIGLIILKL